MALAKAIGYSGIELAAGEIARVPSDPAEIAFALERHEIAPVATLTFLAPLEADLDAFLDFQRRIGNSRVVILAMRLHELGGVTTSAWAAAGKRLNALGRELRERGFELGYHNHLLELYEADGVLPLEILASETAPEHLFFELDLGWVERSGRDPGEVLSHFGDRSKLVHVRDTARDSGPEGAEQFRTPTSVEETSAQVWAWQPFDTYTGDGRTDWRNVIEAGHGTAVESYVVEHDGPGSGETAARKGFDLLADLLRA